MARAQIRKSANELHECAAVKGAQYRGPDPLVARVAGGRRAGVLALARADAGSAGPEAKQHREVRADGRQNDAPPDARLRCQVSSVSHSVSGPSIEATSATITSVATPMRTAKTPHPSSGLNTPSRRSRRYRSAAFRQAVSEVEAASTTCGAGNGTNRYHGKQREAQRHAHDQRDDREAHGQLHLMPRVEAGHQHLHQREADEAHAVRPECVRGHAHVVRRRTRRAPKIVATIGPASRIIPAAAGMPISEDHSQAPIQRR